MKDAMPGAVRATEIGDITAYLYKIVTRKFAYCVREGKMRIRIIAIEGRDKTSNALRQRANWGYSCEVIRQQLNAGAHIASFIEGQTIFRPASVITYFSTEDNLWPEFGQ